MPEIGQNLSHYTLVRKIGKGGMGEVFQARDQRLGRDVAIKVLPEEFARDADRVARFQREAKLLASLNHPHIAAIYGLEESDGTNFLVLELIDGETLADRISAGPISVEESLRLALQIAEGLEAAHENGVIHRDLKPANIKVTPKGMVKVLDFGLAKAFAGEKTDKDPLGSAALNRPATQSGVILGTAAYMSPEQARGERVDQRADIWTFGVVLYEMLTGGQLFGAATFPETIAAVLTKEPELGKIPAEVRPLLRRCLQKDSNRRLRDINDVRLELEEALAIPNEMPASSVAAAEHRTKLRMMLPWLAAALIAGGIIAGLAVWRLKPPEPHPIARFSCSLPADQTFVPDAQVIAISPDGSRFVCATNQGLYLRMMDQLQGRIIPGTEGQVGNPFFSPDGQWVGFWSERDRQLKKIPVSGGSPVTICAAAQINNVQWSAHNVILYDEEARRIMRVSANGGTPEKILESKNEHLFAPQLLPDGTNLLLALSPVTRYNDLKVAVQSLESGTRKELFAGWGARYLPTGHLVYVQGRTLFAVPFDPDRLEVTGDHVPMVQGIAGAPPRYAVSGSGALIYMQSGGESGEERLLFWVDRNGKEEALDAPPRAYVYAHLSPDATRIALDIRDQENDIWIWDLVGRTLARLTFDPGMNWGGIWTPDGKSVAYSTERNGAANIWLRPADGSGSPEPLTNLPEAGLFAESFSPDGKQLLITGQIPPFNIGLLSMGASAAPKPLLESKFDQFNAQISPDGRWVAYQSNESGRTEIYVRPFPNVNTGCWQITTEGGTRPSWNKNGREIFYYLPPGTMMLVPVETGTSFKAGVPRVLFKGDYPAPVNRTQYSVTPDGRRFLMIKDARAKFGIGALQQQVNIVLNWLEELKQRVPVK